MERKWRRNCEEVVRDDVQKGKRPTQQSEWSIFKCDWIRVKRGSKKKKKGEETNKMFFANSTICKRTTSN